MNRFRLLLAGLRHYWRSHLAVALGTAIAAAVLAGALVVGDSVRASLRAMTLDRLGKVDFAMSGPRFVREALGEEAVEAARSHGQEVEVAPAIAVTAALEMSKGDSLRRAAGVSVVACDERLWDFLPHGSLTTPGENEVVLSRRAAEQLNAEVGDQVSVFVEIPQTIPRDALLGDREQTVSELLLTVSGIADESNAIARFGLNPSLQLPL
jgi:ABC-type lipoprotein release transport system permease subunit